MTLLLIIERGSNERGEEEEEERVTQMLGFAPEIFPRSQCVAHLIRISFANYFRFVIHGYHWIVNVYWADVLFSFLCLRLRLLRLLVVDG